MSEQVIVTKGVYDANAHQLVIMACRIVADHGLEAQEELARSIQSGELDPGDADELHSALWWALHDTGNIPNR